MIQRLLKSKRTLRLIRASFFLEKFKLLLAVASLKTGALTSYLFIHKGVGERMFKLLNRSKIQKYVLSNITPYSVATTLAYSIPAMLLL
jgi:hypothetical protein